MLQPHQPSPEQQLITSRIMWGALTFSMLIYGYVLFTLGKLTRFEELSQVPSEIQYAALLSNAIALGVYYLHKNKVLPEKDLQKRFPLSIICWALNEWIVIMGFVATFLADDGNGLLYLTNLSVGLISQAMTFPKK